MADKAISVYIGATLPERPLYPILKRHLGVSEYVGPKPFRAIFDEMDFGFINVVHNPAEADFFMVPHNYSFAQKERGYIEHFTRLAQEHNKKILLFHYSDESEYEKIPNAQVFCVGQYKYKKQDNEIIMVPQVYGGDILLDENFSIRQKSEKPVVSFCGWSEFQSLRQRLRYYQKLLLCDFRSIVLHDSHANAHKQGVYFRRKAMRTLLNSPRVETSFISRDFYVANKHAKRAMTQEAMRAEYLKNIQESDFVLAPRGDGNFSVRFYEALALGRIPVLVDTESILPLEKEIKYRDFVVVVPHEDVGRVEEYILDFYNKHSPEEFAAAQVQARETFKKYLRFDAFLKHVLSQMQK
ncbi:MAG: exostosin family protein [Parcubacteria group bacterium]|nr:exostosin family protein [Parcubacteria group bacterium]